MRKLKKPIKRESDKLVECYAIEGVQPVSPSNPTYNNGSGNNSGSGSSGGGSNGGGGNGGTKSGCSGSGGSFSGSAAIPGITMFA